MAAEDASDAALARDCADPARRAAAERELCRRFAPRIRFYGLKHLRDEPRAEDLVQSVLLAVLEALRAGRVEDLERVDRFVLGTCRYLTLQRRAADGRAEPADPAALDVGSVAPETSAVDFPALWRCLSVLDLRAQTILHLAFYREKSSDDIARVLDTTPGNVRVARHRAMLQLRGCLGGP